MGRFVLEELFHSSKSDKDGVYNWPRSIDCNGVEVQRVQQHMLSNIWPMLPSPSPQGSKRRLEKFLVSDLRRWLKVVLDHVLLMKQSEVLWVSLPVLGWKYQFSKLSAIYFFIISELRIGRVFSSWYISFFLLLSCKKLARNCKK